MNTKPLMSWKPPDSSRCTRKPLDDGHLQERYPVLNQASPGCFWRQILQTGCAHSTVIGGKRRKVKEETHVT